MKSIEEERARCREKYHRLYKGKKSDPVIRKRGDLNYKEKYPEKYAAGKAIRNWKRKPGIDFHHWSYRKEHRKDTIELLKNDHYISHRYLIYDQENMMYRTTQGILLDSKDAHENYIKSIIQNAI